MKEIGQTIGEYRVLEPLGSGGVGTAYKAVNTQTDKYVAVKLMHDRLQSDPDVQNRFVREVSVLEKLDHPNVVRYIDSGLDDGRLYFAMEWVEFGSLEDVLRRRGMLPWREAVECAIQICNGLEHAHERGIIHRDLKPGNLFLAADGLIKVGDFGLARDADMHRLTMSGNTVGSCRYMAPEQVRGEDDLTGAVDLYALGCLTFRMLAGHVPYDGANIMEVFEHHIYSDIPRLPKATDDRPAELDTLVYRLMAKNAAKRPGKAAEVRVALEAVLAGDDVPTEFTSAKPTAESDDKSAEQSEPENLTQRLIKEDTHASSAGGSKWALIAVIGIAVIVGIILFVTQR